MIKVVRFVARSFDLDHLDLFWEIEDFSSDVDVITAYEMFILRSESPEGPWDQLAGPFKDRYEFRDVSPNLLHKWRKLFYKLRIVDARTNEEEEFGPVSLSAEPDLLAMEVIRQEDVLFREYIGRKHWVFPVRTFGQQCVCFDSVLGRRTRSHCLTCYDTGYLGGFHRPVETYIQVDPSADHSSNRAVGGEHQSKNTSARMLYPPVKPKDIIVSPENTRWRVGPVGKTTRLGATLHYEATLHEIPKGDMEYKLPVNLDDLENTSFAATRNYTNPQHVHGENEDADDLLVLYGSKPRGVP